MVSWPTWSPGPHEASDAFLELTASFLARWQGDAEGWCEVRLLDTDEVPYREGTAAAGETIAANARLLAGTPHWLRTGTVPRTDRYLLDEAGPGGIEALSNPLVPDRMTGPGFTQSVAGRKWRNMIHLDQPPGEPTS